MDSHPKASSVPQVSLAPSEAESEAAVENVKDESIKSEKFIDNKETITTI